MLVTFGITFENVLLPFLFIILPFLSFTIPMAYLFAVVIAFGRLSTDGEFTALLAGGYSLARAAVPILLVGGVLYGIAASAAMYLEPWGRRELVRFYHRKAQTELDNLIKFKMQAGVFNNDFLGFVMYAESISPDRTRFDNVMLAPGNGKSDQAYTLLAPSGSISGSVENGDLKMGFDYGVIYSSRPGSDASSVVKFKRAELDILRIFQQQIFGEDSSDKDYRAMPPGRLSDFIDELENNEEAQKLYRKARYLFHQRLATPFAVVVFAMFALVIGIQDPRKGKGSAYINAIVTVISAYILLMSFKWMAENGRMAAPIAAWLPNAILIMFGGFLLFQKNRLPPSEPTLDPRNIPGLRRFF